MDMPHKKHGIYKHVVSSSNGFLVHQQVTEKKHNFCVTSSCFDVAFSKFREDLFFPLGCMVLEGIFTDIQYLQFRKQKQAILAN